MITIDEAKSIVEDRFKVKVKTVLKYGDEFYLLMAPHSDTDYSDPMYLVGIADGRCRFLNPLEDFEAFQKSIDNGPLKQY